jgi:hypothetical protein
MPPEENALLISKDPLSLPAGEGSGYSALVAVLQDLQEWVHQKPARFRRRRS